MDSASLSRKRILLIMAGAMLGILLASLDSTIVGTAMPQIINSLHGFNLYTWPVTAYLLCMTVSMPIFGKLADVYGFKPVYVFGIAVFLIGSALCGLAQNMAQLMLFRGIQGIGGAILISNTLAVVGILFTPVKRAKYAGIVSSASGLASIIGPTLGGYITDHLNWRWVFYVNIPLGIITLLIILLVFPGHMGHQEKKAIDYAGAAVFVIALVPMLLAFTWGGKDYAWNSVQILGLFAFSLLMLLVFARIESGVKDPILPKSLFKNAIFNFSAIEMFLIYAVMMGASIFIPLFLQGVTGSSASRSGAIITPMLVSLILGVMISGFTISKTCRYKLLTIAGFVVMGAGTLMLTMVDTGTKGSRVFIDMTVIGFGMGIVVAVFNVIAQNAFPKSQLGVVTSGVQFFRLMGQTVASSILGTVMSTSINHQFKHMDVHGLPSTVTALLKNPNTAASKEAVGQIKAQIPEKMLPAFENLMGQVRHALSYAVHNIFVIMVVIAGVALVISLFLKEIPISRDSHEEAEPDAEDGGYDGCSSQKGAVTTED